MPRRKAVPAPKRTQVERLYHDEAKRTNIPTNELSPFLLQDAAAPKAMLYERDPSLDPQLVWKGKDDQDRRPLEVQVLPIYIQEKIHPKALVEDLRAHSPDQRHGQVELFSDFNGIEFEELVEFYQHEQSWTNRMILGDSLEVMNSLAEKEGLKGAVQTIYVDPPYGIKFGSNWQVSTRRRDVRDGRAEDATRQPEQVKAFRDTWELGIHSYLSYLRDRLQVMRNLLTSSGSIFVQIGQDNIHLVRSVLDEVFGANNLVAQIHFVTTSGFDTTRLAHVGSYLLWYGRTTDVKFRPLWEPIDKSAEASGYRWLRLADGTTRGMLASELRNDEPLPSNAVVYQPTALTSQGSAAAPQPFEYRGRTYYPGENAHWKARWPEGMQRLGWAGRLHVAANSLRFVRRVDDFGFKARTSL